MRECCAICKHMIYRKEYIYPYKCLKDKSKSYSHDEIDRRIMSGYKCDKYEFGFNQPKEVE